MINYHYTSQANDYTVKHTINDGHLTFNIASANSLHIDSFKEKLESYFNFAFSSVYLSDSRIEKFSQKMGNLRRTVETMSEHQKEFDELFKIYMFNQKLERELPIHVSEPIKKLKI